MNKYLKSIAFAGLSVTLAMGICMMAACGPENEKKPDDTDDPGDTTTYYTVSFESNGGSAVEAQQVAEGEHAVEPDDPEKDGFDFDGWYSEESFATLYDFSGTAVTEDITLYAKWEEASAVVPGGDDDKGIATFYWNYDYDNSGTLNDAGDIYTTQEFTYGKNISKVDEPKRAGYEFDDWYTAEGEKYNRMAKYTEDVTVYARWVIEYTFEAEKTQLTGLDYNSEDNMTYDTITENGDKVGVELSGSANGQKMIRSSSKASGGQYVAGIDYTGAYLDFEFTSDKAESGVSLKMRLSARFRTLYMSAKTASSKVDILVNGVAVMYDDITIERSDNVQDMGGGDCEDYFQNFYIGNIDIKEGDNVIRIYVDNSSSRPDGTVRAYAPVVDCIYLTSSATLKFTEYENK